MIINGALDNLPEQAFYMVGTIEEAVGLHVYWSGLKTGFPPVPGPAPQAQMGFAALTQEQASPVLLQ